MAKVAKMIGAGSAKRADPAFPVLNVSRAGLGAYSKPISGLYSTDSIGKNNVLPGCTDSLLQIPKSTAKVPLVCMGVVIEASATFALPASDTTAYVTGKNIRVDRGETRSV